MAVAKEGLNMSLVVGLKVTMNHNGRVQLAGIDEVVVQRLEPLEDKNSPNDEVHNYRVTLMSTAQEVTISHRYGDGALRLLEIALQHLRLENQSEPV